MPPLMEPTLTDILANVKVHKLLLLSELKFSTILYKYFTFQLKLNPKANLVTMEDTLTDNLMAVLTTATLDTVILDLTMVDTDTPLLTTTDTTSIELPDLPRPNTKMYLPNQNYSSKL